MKHDNNAYQSGCRCHTCRLAHSIYMNRYRAAREKRGGKITERGIIGGAITEPSGPTVKQIDDLRRRLSIASTAAVCGISTRTVRELHLRLRPRVHPRVAAAVRDAWYDHCAPIPVDRRRWPSETVKHAVIARYGSLRASPWREDVARITRNGDISTDTAERWAERLGLLPCELWPDWFDMPVEEAS